MLQKKANVMSKKRIVLSAGGTGGHLFPAQAVAKELSSHAEVLFVGGGLSTNRYFEQTQFPFEEVSSSTFSLGRPFQLLKGSIRLLKGIYESRRVLAKFCPDLVVGFGSFFTFPVLAAAWMKHIPILIHEQNAIPGKVNRLFSSVAITTAITFPYSSSLLKGNSTLVQFPLRSRVQKDERMNKDAWNYFGLTPGPLTLLIFGGSQGANRLNTLFFEAAHLIGDRFQVLHFTGKEESAEKARALYATLKIHAYVKPFENRMDLALQIADLALTRAGAATISELIASETPAILIPFPYATENHQLKNAEYFVHHVGGGRLLIEEHTTGSVLAEILNQELGLKEKRRNIQHHKATETFQSLIDLILTVASIERKE